MKARVLNMAATAWLENCRRSLAGDTEQQRLHRAALKYIGGIDGGRKSRSGTASERVRRALRRRFGR